VTTTGYQSQPHSWGTPEQPGNTLCPDNGGNSGAGYSIEIFHPAALRTIQYGLSDGIFTLQPLSGPKDPLFTISLQSLLIIG
jgi:hypothetical protein